MLVQAWLLDQIYTLLSQREFENEEDQQKQTVSIEKNTHTGKIPP